MASYHLSAQPVKRSEGRSVVAMAAYRAGVLLRDDRRNSEADYRRRLGVQHAEIMAPEGTAEWLYNREELWNAVERLEVRRDAQLAREINMALPHELSDEERLALVREFVREQFVSLGMVADFAIHAPVPGKGDDPRNYHVHILLTMRKAGYWGLWRVKTREWNSDELLLRWRAAWADHQNRALRSLGLKARVDHRSFAARKREAQESGHRNRSLLFDREPELHVGPKAKKAGRALPLMSKTKSVGPHRKRVLDYGRFDAGSRGEFNIGRLSANADHLQKLMARTQARVARLQTRRVFYERQVQRYAPAAPARVSSFAMSEGSESKYLHALRRREQVALLVSELDQLFFELLDLRESQLVRRTVWSNRLRRWRARDVTPSDGRSRPHR
ncbi:MobA/MobL family protein [Bradyrhizobium sp. UFLA01-814]|uniref:MobQ family relaxase n=1 Tax=Bradyrhizobium sp. UFLA01-814 TaxID=3023480 RepID=UPI00398B1DBE